MKQPPMKQIFVKKVIVFAVPAFLTAWLYNVIIGDILFTTCALFGFLRYPIYYLLTGAVFFLIPATAFRISKENNGNEKREYLRLMSGKDFDLAEAKVMRKNDKLQLCEFFAFAVAELIACVWGLRVMGLLIFVMLLVPFWFYNRALWMKMHSGWMAERIYKGELLKPEDEKPVKRKWEE